MFAVPAAATVVGALAQVKVPGNGGSTPGNPAQEAIEQLTNLSDACGRDPSWTCERVYDLTGSTTWAGAAEWFVAKPLSILITVIVAIVITRLAHVMIKRMMRRIMDQSRARRALHRATPAILQRTTEHSLRTDARVQTLTGVFRGFATVVIWFVAIIVILDILQIDLAPLITLAGLFGVALGFGAQNIVRDFLAGTFIVVEDQFGVGDIVDVGDAKGTVEQVTLRSTRIRDVNGTLWHVPNGQILRVANKSQEWARAVLDIEVDAGTDYDEAAEVILSVATAMASEEDWMAEVLASPEVWGIESFSDSGYTIRLVIKTRPSSQFPVMRELRIRLHGAFAESGIRPPGGGRPELWVHVDDAAVADEAKAAEEAAKQAELAAKEATAAEAGTSSKAAPPEHPTRGDPSEAG